MSLYFKMLNKNIIVHKIHPNYIHVIYDPSFLSLSYNMFHIISDLVILFKVVSE